jgi:acetylornithine deacetylase/succinyl-diaminopimelate desuccinylase-like protein
MLFGPGSILDAHTDHEKVAKRDLEKAAAVLERTVRTVLSAPASAAAGRNA